MPTGYTAPVLENPRLTFREFALRCTRAMGVCIEMRDEPLDVLPKLEEIVPNMYYKEQLEKAEARSRQLEVMTIAEAQAECDAAHRESEGSIKQIEAKWAEENRRLNRMLGEVMAWEPPTSDHFGLKKFMVEQLEISMNKSSPFNETEKMTAEEWLADSRKDAAEQVVRHRERWKAEQEQARKKTEWLAALFASLENV